MIYIALLSSDIHGYGTLVICSIKKQKRQKYYFDYNYTSNLKA